MDECSNSSLILRQKARDGRGQIGGEQVALSPCGLQALPPLDNFEGVKTWGT